MYTSFVREVKDFSIVLHVQDDEETLYRNVKWGTEGDLPITKFDLIFFWVDDFLI